MLTAAQIIDKLGGAAVIGKALDLPLTTVASWGAVNFIPSWRQPSLIALALQQKEPLSTADFPTRDQRIPRAQKAAA